MRSRRQFAVLLLVWSIVHSVHAQSEDMAFQGGRSSLPEHDDRGTLAMERGHELGALGLKLPEGTYAMDILDKRGRVVQRLHGPEMRALAISELQPGTWTLRASTPNGYSLRRFVVLRKGHVAWALPEPVKHKLR